LCIVTLFAVLPVEALRAQNPAGNPADDAEQTIRLLYDLISAEAGSIPDWAPVRELFLEESVIILRSSRDMMSVLSLDGFIRDFEEFYATPQVRANGFKETILELKATEFGDMAQVWVLYEARIPGGGGNRGLDNFSLIRRGGTWRVAAITNEVVFPDGPAPTQLFD
jgi:hypothetical protein